MTGIPDTKKEVVLVMATTCMPTLGAGRVSER